MAEIRSVCVYCGSAPGADPAYADAATRFGTMLGERGIRLVYGGGKVGLMGAVAKAAKAAGGEVVGIIPKALATKEIANRDVDSMHARKARMAELADAFATLPGGLGTLEELFETWTWGQLGWHDKPIGFLNVGGFYDPLLALVEGMVGAGFIRPAHLGLVHVDADPEGLLGRMRAHVPPVVKRYIGAEDPVAVG